MSLTKPTGTVNGAQQPLRRTEVRAALRRHRGSIKAIAENLDVTVTSVVQWLNGRMTSRNIERACHERAAELLKMEKRDAA